MIPLIAYPFELDPTGSVAVADQASDEYQAMLLAVLIQTRLEERIPVPGFGIDDIPFGTLTSAELQIPVSVYGPPVQITEVATKIVNETTQDVLVSFER